MDRATPTSAFERARQQLRALGVILKQAPGEYLLNHASVPFDRNPTRALDLHDALAAGYALARNPPPEHEAMGPLGNPRSQRVLVRRHNRKVLKRRLKKKADAIAAEITEKVTRK